MTKTKTKRHGLPAAAILANGISRHGRHCYCAICLDVYKPCSTCGGIHVDADCFGEPVQP